VGTTKPRRRGLILVGAATALLLGNTNLAMAMTQSGPTDDGKVLVCHATDSNENPYVLEEPAKDGDVSGHGDHIGPLWGPDLKAAHIVWGDIIPAFDYPDGNGGTAHYPGLNWPAGQATLEHGCAPFVVPALALTVDKTNDANGNGTFSDAETATTAGAAVPFKVSVTNDGDAAVVIDSVVDQVGGSAVAFDCLDAASHSLVGQVVPIGATVTCTVTLAGAAPAAGGTSVDTVTVTAHQYGDCVLSQTELLLRAASSKAADSCELQTDPGNTVTDADTSSVSTPAAPLPTPTPTITVSPTPDVTVSPTPDTTVSPTPEATVEPTATAEPTTGGGGTIVLPSESPTPFTGGGGTVTLPHTGAPTDVLLSVAAGLLALGTWLTVLGRRRKA
jgi:LPXTG-motif cell wall-anchored protein